MSYLLFIDFRLFFYLILLLSLGFVKLKLICKWFYNKARY
jgi:hypothetical protein